MFDINGWNAIFGILLFVLAGAYKYFTKQNWNGFNAVLNLILIFGLVRLLLEGVAIFLYTAFSYPFLIQSLDDLRQNILLSGAILILLSLYMYKKLLGIDIFKDKEEAK